MGWLVSLPIATQERLIGGRMLTRAELAEELSLPTGEAEELFAETEEDMDEITEGGQSKPHPNSLAGCLAACTKLLCEVDFVVDVTALPDYPLPLDAMAQTVKRQDLEENVASMMTLLRSISRVQDSIHTRLVALEAH